MRRQTLLALAILIVAGLSASSWLDRRAPQNAGWWQGYAEADFVKVAPTQQGLLTTIDVARGDQASAGALLFTQDDTADRAARDQAARSVEQARQQLANLKAPAKPTEIFQAEANLAEALAAADRARADFDRAQALAGTGAVTPQILDQRRADYQSAEAKVKALEAALANLRAPMGREAEIKAQEAAVRAAEAALEAAEWRLSQRRVSAPAAGKVADVLARPGETVAAGFAVVSLLPPENIFVRFFVPEPELARVQRGEPVGLVCDNCPTDLSATIAFVSPKAEYTPPVIYSESSRAKLVYMIEARPAADQARLLNPGQPIDVRPVRAARPP